MGMISTKLRNSAEGEYCTFHIVGHCVGGTETTVLCHAPSEVKGMGTKSPDYWSAFGCMGCHNALDRRLIPIKDEHYYWLRAIRRTWARWIERGLIVLPVDPSTAKTRPKKKANLPSRPLRSRGFDSTRSLSQRNQLSQTGGTDELD